ncbi:aminotransferase class I/II-fold pyridoxal phosphate-dependent enzyme [Candidatus Bathyarchaeota archaeon]|nr:aminotransferase class I/II-fold pyridoxal phosphate-dependent enzyme [Candidatus Bathyarchaeota archaeon]
MIKKLEEIRQVVREIDDQILQLAGNRLELVKRIGEIKRKHNLPITNLNVEAMVIDKTLDRAKAIGLNENFSKKLMNLIIAESVKTQEGTSKNRASFLYNVLETVKELEAKGEKVIRLDVGEPDLASPIQIKDALKDNLYGREVIGYSSSKGLGVLREAIANDLNQKYDADITQDQVLITPGGKFGIFAAIFSKVSFGERVIIPQPTWPVYENCTKLINGRVNTIHTTFEEKWRIDLQKIHDVCRVKPKLLILCSPNNPTGKIIPKKDLEEMMQLAEKKNLYILSDEVYQAYSFKAHNSILQLANSNFIYVNSFSKKFGMTGWRVGYAVSDKETISKMQKIIQISVTCVPEFIQKASFKALTMEQKRFEDYSIKMKERVQIACEEIKGKYLNCIEPEGGMYIFPKSTIDGFQSMDFAHKLLDRKRVSVTPGDAFGEYPEHFRISLGRNKDQIREGIKKIHEEIEEWQKG